MIRQRWIRARAIVVLPLVLTFAAAGCGSDTQSGKAEGDSTSFDQALQDRLPKGIRRSGVIRIATDATYAPASFFAPDGRTVVGFEPDLAAAMARVLGVDIEFVVTDFEEVLDAVEADDVDLIMSAMTDTPERERRVDFVNYFTAGTAIVVQRSNPLGITDIDSLCGQVVVVEAGTVQLDLLRRTQPGCGSTPIRIRSHGTNTDALVELRTGRAAAILTDYPPAVHLATDPRTQSDYQLATDTQYEPGPYGIGVAKGDVRLREAIVAALEQVMSSGEYEQVLTDWDVSAGAVPSVTVNAG